MCQKLYFLEGVCPVASGIKPSQHFIKRTSSQQSNVVVVLSGRQFMTSSSSALGLCSRTMIPNTAASSPLNGSRKKLIKALEWPSHNPDLNPIEMPWHDLKQSFHAKKTRQYDWIKTIQQRRVGQNSSTAMWKTHCQLSQMLDCSWTVYIYIYIHIKSPCSQKCYPLKLIFDPQNHICKCFFLWKELYHVLTWMLECNSCLIYYTQIYEYAN